MIFQSYNVICTATFFSVHSVYMPTLHSPLTASQYSVNRGIKGWANWCMQRHTIVPAASLSRLLLVTDWTWWRHAVPLTRGRLRWVRHCAIAHEADSRAQPARGRTDHSCYNIDFGTESIKTWFLYLNKKMKKYRTKTCSFRLDAMLQCIQCVPKMWNLFRILCTKNYSYRFIFFTIQYNTIFVYYELTERSSIWET